MRPVLMDSPDDDAALSSAACPTCRQQKAELAEKLKAKAEELAQEFKDEWQPVAENLDRAMKAFDDLEGACEPDHL